MTVYDRLAPGFDRQRPLPAGVPEAIRGAVLAELPPHPRLADIGCGAGRVGCAFAAAGDDYTAVDLSFGMLQAFAARGLPAGPRLAQADGARLPFPDAQFDGILLVQVLSGTRDSLGLLRDVRRVLRPGGALFIGRSMAPDNGLDARMKQRLAEILAGMHEHPYRQQAKDSAFDWLDRHARLTIRPVAHWPTERTPRQFIARHGGGVRFSALDPAIQAAAMAQLTNWARATFGTLDTAATERQCFELKIYRFHQGTAA